MFNSTIVGRVGTDPGQRQVGTSAVANFNLAVEQIKRRDQADPPAFWISIDCWGKQSEYVMNNIRKGDRVVVSGDVQQQHWQDKQSGEQKSKLSLNCNRVIRVGRPGDDGQGGGQRGGAQGGGYEQRQQGGSPQQSWNSGYSGDEEDIPF